MDLFEHAEQKAADLKASEDAVFAAMEQYRAAAQASMAAARTCHERTAVVKQVKQGVSAQRKLFNRLVRTLATERLHGNFREAYMTVYRRLESLYGYAPYAELEHYRGAHLDAVERAGYMDACVRIARASLA